MAIDGKITRTDDDAITGWIASLTFDVDITLTKNPHKAKETHPDYEIATCTPRNRAIRIGSAWEQTSQKGNDYFSLSVMVNGQQIRVNALRSDEDPEGKYRLVPLAGEGRLRWPGRRAADVKTRIPLTANSVAYLPGGGFLQ